MNISTENCSSMLRKCFSWGWLIKYVDNAVPCLLIHPHLHIAYLFRAYAPIHLAMFMAMFMGFRQQCIVVFQTKTI